MTVDCATQIKLDLNIYLILKFSFITCLDASVFSMQKPFSGNFHQNCIDFILNATVKMRVFEIS